MRFRLPFTRRGEPRAQAGANSYTQQAVNALTEAVLSPVSGDALAAAVYSVNTIAAHMMLGRLGSPNNDDPLDPDALEVLIRQLLVRGEAIIFPVGGTDGSSFYAKHASGWEISGKSTSPQRWEYALDVRTPSGDARINTDGARVWHFRIGATPERPWEGCSPLKQGNLSTSAAVKLERSLALEFGLPVMRVLPIATGGQPEQREATAAAISQGIAGGLAMPAAQILSGAGNTHAEWRPIALGANPGDSLPDLRTQFSDSIRACYGVPAAGASMDDWHIFRHTRIKTLGDLIAREINRKSHRKVEWNWDRLHALDTQATRSMGNLIDPEQKLTPEEAGKVAHGD